jgi:hypothetical protein
MKAVACLIGFILAANIAIDSTRPDIEIFVGCFSMPLFLFFGFMLKEYLDNSSKKD